MNVRLWVGEGGEIGGVGVGKEEGEGSVYVGA